MKKKTVYYIKRDLPPAYLDQRGGWVKKAISYGLASFDTEDAAKAAIPAGVPCTVVSVTERTEGAS
jgi:hypothetical protein